jgi:hypothetical protein
MFERRMAESSILHDTLFLVEGEKLVEDCIVTRLGPSLGLNTLLIGILVVILRIEIEPEYAYLLGHVHIGVVKWQVGVDNR